MIPHAAADSRGSESALADQPELIAQSHERSKSYGLRPYESPDFCPVLQSELKTEIERSQSLFAHALPVMETLYSQIVNTQSMVILTDTSGLILHSLGDDDFLAQASKVALQPGASWSEEARGTNAIGTALADAKPTLVHGSEHYLQANQFLTCSCAPIFDPYGATVGALDVTGDHRGFHKHTMALVRMSAQMIENQLFANTFQDVVCIHFHSRPEFIGTLVEGIAAFTPAGRFLSANRSGEFQLGLSSRSLHAHTFSSLFGLSMSQLIDRERSAPAGIVQLQLPSGVKVFARVEWKRPANRIVGGAIGTDMPIDRDTAPRRPYIEPARQPASLEALDTGDAQIKTVIGKLRKVIGKGITIMVLGETGTGKELVARSLHMLSPRHDKPFIALNCGAVPEQIFESEMFGHEAGAFTGAGKRRIGKLEHASGGTLFLDEIESMPIALQVKLLRVLQEGALERLGSNVSVRIDVRIVAAAKGDMEALIDAGGFRRDLYYRLNVVAIDLPPLRERREDIIPLFEHFLLEAAVRYQRPLPMLAERQRHELMQSSWPGNVRELRNAADRLVLGVGRTPVVTDASEDGMPLKERVERYERTVIAETLARTGGSVHQAADILQVGRATLYDKIKRYGL